jgi:NAD(P)H-dependent FMN reductase
VNRSPHILVILGSTRQGRQGDKVIQWLMSRLNARSDAAFELVDLRDVALPIFDAAVPPAFGAVAEEARGWSAQVAHADGFIFVMPEYNHGYPASLKNAIDHLFKEWARKPAAIVSYGASGGGYRGAEQLRQVLIELKMVPVREQVGVATVWDAFDASGAPRHAALDGSIAAMVGELLWWTAALGAARELDPGALTARASA